MAIKDTLRETSDVAYVDLLGTYGETLRDAGQYSQAVAIEQRGTRIVDSIGRGGMLLRNLLRHNWANNLVALGEMTEAEVIFHETVQVSARSDTGRIHWQPLIHYAETALFEGHGDSVQKWLADETVCPPGGESWHELGDRVMGWWADTAKRYEKRTVLAVMHGGPILWIGRHFTGGSREAMGALFVEPTSISVRR